MNIYKTSHIEIIIDDNSRLCLIVEDTELNDFVEDFLYDNLSVSATETEIEDHGTFSKYYNYFDNSITSKTLKESIETIDRLEIERIFKINN